MLFRLTSRSSWGFSNHRFCGVIGLSRQPWPSANTSPITLPRSTSSGSVSPFVTLILLRTHESPFTGLFETEWPSVRSADALVRMSGTMLEETRGRGRPRSFGQRRRVGDHVDYAVGDHVHGHYVPGAEPRTKKHGHDADGPNHGSPGGR